ncbi:hypothetical protein BCF33_0532 [Hasllibacter halocynthiae]|uniref:Protease inhibitor Inh n=1 Tax=Hasllibacter halocynthiae TaxID=595589 RepID=A0A2T0X7L6_9RHOB|nr:hypothetical protein [Hasllibacter halocynthiae]PRY94929.1 hypothetical protein BCF33_0532 [Hasllibacter halocynthiae]
MRRALLLALLAALPAAAQQSLTPDEFLDRVEGRTIRFTDTFSGAPVGTEEFLSRTRTVWAEADGTCVVGFVTVEGPTICFRYPDEYGDERWCWWPFEAEGDLHVRLARPGAADVQRATPVDATVQCEGRPSV